MNKAMKEGEEYWSLRDFLAST